VFHRGVTEETDGEDDALFESLIEFGGFGEAVDLTGKADKRVPTWDISNLTEY
jgi:hypothetical protein